MNDRQVQIRLGLGAIAAAAIFILVAIPMLVSTPSNVPNIILSPLFWPNTLAVFTGIIGLGMVMTALKTAKSDTRSQSDVDDRRTAFIRLINIAILMVFMIYAMPKIGLVWACMIAFVVSAFLVRTRNPITALVSAIVVPLLLYVFFAHVAGVAIPQGDFVRLP